MTDFGDGDELYFVCICINNYEEDVRNHAKIIDQHPGFSLAHFTYNLAGKILNHISKPGKKTQALMLSEFFSMPG